MNVSLVESPFIPSWARQLDIDQLFIYTGPSMAPTFKPGDLLGAQKINLRSIHLGDIVIISRQNNATHSETIVHRVIAINQECLITQGDNNFRSDSQVVAIDNFVGLATFFKRRDRIFPIRGGYQGLLYATLLHAWNNIWMLIKLKGSHVYHHIRKSGLITTIWKPAISQIRVTTDQGPLVKYIYGKRTVGRWWPEQQQFEIEKPFDLVIHRPEYQSEFP